jgi:uncharacterized Zn finger protein (UPF0148 family)
VVVESTLIQASTEDPRSLSYEPRLRPLMDSWINAGCRYDRWEKANPAHAKALGTALQWKLEFWPDERGRPTPVLSCHPRLGEPIDVEEYTGYNAFVEFLLSAARSCRVGRCDRCGRFFWNRWGHLNKRFCGRKCSQLKTASEGQARKCAAQRREKNKRVRKALTEFVEEETAVTDWKTWVARRARVTRSYLTRALNRGLRGEPDGVKLTKRKIQYLESKGESRHGNL